MTIYPKTGNWSGKTTGKKRHRQLQTGGFLNHYDFAYTGRDTVNQVSKIAPNTVNQVSKIAPNIIKQAMGEISKIAQERIDQAIRSGGSEIE